MANNEIRDCLLPARCSGLEIAERCAGSRIVACFSVGVSVAKEVAVHGLQDGIQPLKELRTMTTRTLSSHSFCAATLTRP